MNGKKKPTKRRSGAGTAGRRNGCAKALEQELWRDSGPFGHCSWNRVGNRHRAAGQGEVQEVGGAQYIRPYKPRSGDRILFKGLKKAL